MPVPSSIADLSQTAGSNSPAGSESPALLDDYHRTTYSFIAKLRDGQGFSNPVDLASAATTDIGAQTSFAVRITGTTTITSFGANYAGLRVLIFGGALTLTHNATTLVLPGGANITTAAGDCAVAVPNLATPTGWRVVSYFPAALVPGSIVGTLPVNKGGTGATDAATARTNLGISTGETGDIVQKARINAPSGWVKCNGTTIGNAASGATGRANADTEALFTLLWNEFPQTVLAIQTSAGGASTRGASAAADYAANKRLPIFDLRGEFLRGLDESRGVDSGRDIGTAQSSANLLHDHNFDYASDPVGGGSYVNRVVRATSAAGSLGSGNGATVGMASTGSSESRPRNIAFPFFMKL